MGPLMFLFPYRGCRSIVSWYRHRCGGPLLVIRHTTHFERLGHVHVLVPSSRERVTPSHLMTMFSSRIRPVCKPISEFTILKVEAGLKRMVSYFMLYTVISPSALLSMVKHPSTLFSSKYFFRLSSLVALFTVQEASDTKQAAKISFRSVSLWIMSIIFLARWLAVASGGCCKSLAKAAYKRFL